MKSSTTLGTLIAAARKAKNLNQDALSSAMGYPYKIASKWENDKRRPTADEWERLTELLPIDLEAAAPLLAEGLSPGGPKAPPTKGGLRIAPEVGKRLRALRESANIPALYVAEQLKLAPSVISRMESGKTSPTYDNLRRLVRLYGTSYDYVLDGVGSPTDSLAHLKEQVSHLRRTLRAILDPGAAQSLAEALANDPAARAALLE